MTAGLLDSLCQHCDHPARHHRFSRAPDPDSGRTDPTFRCTWPLPGGSPFESACGCPDFVPPPDWPA